MKIIKKIAAIMLSVMMVLGMCSVVGAEGTETISGTGTSGTTGSITINKAAPEETYKIYRILNLESYNEATKNYAYKLRTDKVQGSEKSWSEFINSPEIKNVYVTLDGDYVTWKDKADVAQFAKLALNYAKDNTTKIVADTTATAPKAVSGATTSTVTFTDLQLGYYLVETSVGTVLALDTTKPNATIEEKNGVPSVEKKVQEDSTSKWESSNTADIGQTVNFQTTITAQAGAQNYVLHDKMDAGLTFKDDVQIQWIKKSGDTTTSLTKGTDYDVTTTDLESTDPKCTFHVTFKSDFCNKLAKDDTIVITYSATLNENAVIAGDGNKNETWLKYGDSSVTTHKTTTTKTYKIPVFKYTKKTAENKTGLPNAEFTLSKNTDGTNPIKLVDITNGAAESKYRVAKTGEATTTDKVITPATGKFTIQGLDADIYYLTETKQPDGYNKLSKAVKIVIDEKGNITVDDKTPSTELVEVENKTGSILPSTGGMGTTLFYIFGAILVIGSGVVLITKKRMK